MKRIIACLSAFFVVMAIASTVSAITTEAKIVASDGGAANNGFGGNGSGVSVSGDFAIVGATGSRAAYVFHYDGEKWSEQQKLIASDAAPDYWTSYGNSVSISGNNAIVGAYNADGNLTHSGAAYIYHYDGMSWVEQQKLVASDGAIADYGGGIVLPGLFGFSVSIAGDYAIVGAREADSDVFRSGAAYIYHYDGTSWVELQKLSASDRGLGDRFGHTVAISSEYAIVGAPSDDDIGAETGSAYIYRFDGADWVEQQKLWASDGTFVDRFGWAVSISGNKAIVGTEQGDGEVKDAGSAYIFNYDGKNWVEQQKLLTDDGKLDDRYGTSVSISGDNAIVGALRQDNNEGAAYLYRYDGSDWIETVKLGSTNTDLEAHFGSSVSISGEKAIVGAGGSWNSPGSAYIYKVDSTDPELVDREKGKKCYDGIDNDEDGLLDFADPDCFKKEGKGKTCSDGLDNDGDQLIDCDDSGCSTNRVCK